MELLTKEIEKRLPKLYETDKVPAEEKLIIAKFFDPYGAATWLVCEFDPEEKLFFGYADLFKQGTQGGAEWGYVSLEELQSIKFMGRQRIERDRFFTPKKFGECVDADGCITA